jgi:ribonuclease BN (tRNA processing enzyme)
MRLIFLGTGGGRHMMFSQVRKTGGLYFDLDDIRFMIDPGPGALVHARSLKLPLEKLDGLFVSHLHPDNSADANVLMDGMKDHFLVAEQHCLLPKEKTKSKTDYYPIISAYHQKHAKHLFAVKHNDDVKAGPLKVEVFKSTHYDPTVGFKITHPKIKIGYPADGPYYAGQENHYDGCDVLILNVLVPKGLEPEEERHMSVDDAVKLVRAMKNKPKIVIMQHFSFWMLQHNLFKQAKILQDAIKVPVLNAEDFMELDLSTMKNRILKV